MIPESRLYGSLLAIHLRVRFDRKRRFFMKQHEKVAAVYCRTAHTMILQYLGKEIDLPGWQMTKGMITLDIIGTMDTTA